MPDIFTSTPKTTKLTTDVETTVVVDGNEEDVKFPGDSEAVNPRSGRAVEEYSMVMREEHSSDNPFKAFMAKPHHVFFASQHHEEKVLLLLRRHPITQVGWILIAFGLCLVPSLLNAVGMFDFFPVRYQFAANIGWYLIVLGYILESFLSWFYNVYIITDERIIDVDFFNLLFKNISATKIDNIEDVTIETGGVIASIVNFGTVKIQTAGAVTEFEFEDVPQPAKVTAFLNELIVEEEKEKIENRAN